MVFNFPKFNGLSYEEWGPYWVNKFDSSLPRAFWKVLSSVKIKNDIDQLPMIIFYDKRDRVVNFERVEKIFDKWSGPKKIIDIKLLARFLIKCIRVLLMKRLRLI